MASPHPTVLQLRSHLQPDRPEGCPHKRYGWPRLPQGEQKVLELPDPQGLGEPGQWSCPAPAAPCGLPRLPHAPARSRSLWVGPGAGTARTLGRSACFTPCPHFPSGSHSPPSQGTLALSCFPTPPHPTLLLPPAQGTVPYPSACPQGLLSLLPLPSSPWTRSQSPFLWEMPLSYPLPLHSPLTPRADASPQVVLTPASSHRCPPVWAMAGGAS